jgi:transposase
VRKEQKNYTAEKKVAILNRHLVDKEPISGFCDEMALQPTVFYRWQKEFFENGSAAFQTKARPNHQAEQERIDYIFRRRRVANGVADALKMRRKVIMIMQRTTAAGPLAAVSTR